MESSVLKKEVELDSDALPVTHLSLTLGKGS